ncbi:MAG: hypothetical protein B7Y15_13165, partial [Bacteroidetes bacterium 24-39-8]
MLLLFVAIQTEWVQNKLVAEVTERLSKQIGTEIKIEHVSFSLFNKMNLDGVLIRDKQKDS